MAANSDIFLKKVLGDDFFESLAKIELWKPGTNSVVDHEEIKTALKIVPRTIMALLISELAPMKTGENKDIILPVGEDVRLHVGKNERDVYTGDIHEKNEFIVGFKLRSLPGVGLVIMSAFELYNVDELSEPSLSSKPDVQPHAEEQVQALIDERLALHSMVARVVDGKMAQRDAVQAMMLLKLTEELRSQKQAPAPTVGGHIGQIIDEVHEKHPVDLKINEQVYHISKTEKKKGSPLSGFLEKRKDKKKPKEFEIVMVKGETVRCPDCGNALITGKLFTGCICLGDDRDKKVYIKKSETGINVRFGRGWDEENIEMLVDVLRKKNG